MRKLECSQICKFIRFKMIWSSSFVKNNLGAKLCTEVLTLQKTASFYTPKTSWFQIKSITYFELQNLKTICVFHGIYYKSVRNTRFAHCFYIRYTSQTTGYIRLPQTFYRKYYNFICLFFTRTFEKHFVFGLQTSVQNLISDMIFPALYNFKA